MSVPTQNMAQWPAVLCWGDTPDPWRSLCVQGPPDISQHRAGSPRSLTDSTGGTWEPPVPRLQVPHEPERLMTFLQCLL